MPGELFDEEGPEEYGSIPYQKKYVKPINDGQGYDVDIEELNLDNQNVKVQANSMIQNFKKPSDEVTD